MSTKIKGFKWLGTSITCNSLRWFSTCLSYLNGKYKIYFSLTSCKCRIFFRLSIFLYTQLSSMWRATHHFKKVQIARRHMSNMKMCSFLLLKRGLNTHSKKCRHLTMFGNTVPEQFNRFGRLQIFSNKNLISKTFMWFLLTLVSFFYVVSVKPNESYKVVTFFYSSVVFFCNFYHVCPNPSRNRSKIIISFLLYKKKY